MICLFVFRNVMTTEKEQKKKEKIQITPRDQVEKNTKVLSLICISILPHDYGFLWACFSFFSFESADGADTDGETTVSGTVGEERASGEETLCGSAACLETAASLKTVAGSD